MERFNDTAILQYFVEHKTPKDCPVILPGGDKTVLTMFSGCMRQFSLPRKPKEKLWPIGQRLWVKEVWSPRLDVDAKTNPGKAKHYCLYRACGWQPNLPGGDPKDPMNWHPYGSWHPATKMPRWASRFTLTVTKVIKKKRIWVVSFQKEGA